MNKGLFKRLLQHILCILVVPHHSPSYAKDHVCGLFAKNLERSRVSTFCSDKKCVFLSCIHASCGRQARLTSLVITEILRGHAVAPFKRSQLAIPRSSVGSSHSFATSHSTLFCLPRARFLTVVDATFSSRCCAPRVRCKHQSR